MNKIKDQNAKSEGFTLVEMAVVMVITGVLVGSFLSMYSGYLERKRIEDTESDIQAIAKAVDAYFQQYGFYPCPARRDIGAGNANYGVAMDCDLPPPAPAPAVVEIPVGIDLDGVAGVDKTVNLRFGAVPFDDLSLFIDYNVLTTTTNPIRKRSRVRGEDTIDAYGNQYTYVVTVEQATDRFEEGHGGVQIYDEFASTPLASTDVPVSKNGDFIIVSHGANGVGAWNSQGNRVALCSTGLSNEERENCDEDELFIDSLRYDNQGGNFYDDHLAHVEWFPYFLWEESLVNTNAVNSKNTGNVGIGEENPQDKLHIKDGNLQAYNSFGSSFSPSMGTDDDGRVLAQRICTEDGAECFDPDALHNNTIRCNAPNQAMVGVANNAAVCVPLNIPNTTINCGGGRYLRAYGFNVNSNSWTSSCTTIPAPLVP